MHAVWRGVLSFGLVNMPVRLYKTTEKHALPFYMLHQKDLSPIRYARVCKQDGEEIPYNEIVRGYRYREGDYVVLTEEDFRKANLEKSDSIDILDFVYEDEVDAIYFERAYYIEPEPGSEQPYVLLLKALELSGMGGMVQYVSHNREHLGLIKPVDNMLVLTQMRFAEDIRKPEGLNIPAPDEIQVSGREIKLALELIRLQSGPFHPEAYHDTYKEELKAIINEKVAGKTPVAKGKPKMPTAGVLNLVTLLKQSIEQQRQIRRA